MEAHFEAEEELQDYQSAAHMSECKAREDMDDVCTWEGFKSQSNLRESLPYTLAKVCQEKVVRLTHTSG